MNIKIKPEEIYKEYDDGVQYKLSLNLYKNVEDMTPQELREIVFCFIYNISIL